ncbi:hypothetical protein BpHYR1_029172 [Brachionus plicatilis]|uniref:Uncharacterized protein n=1 Tax=Brachionus plicatilis TaxID=10195 RepID=A0A3M7T427_BRAPC|nr:hypothetical protein BpHYR1_029172 [Brachionus plicatilis]
MTAFCFYASVDPHFLRRYLKSRFISDFLTHTTIELVLFYSFRLIKQVFLEISFMNIILASTKSDNPLFIMLFFTSKFTPIVLREEKRNLFTNRLVRLDACYPFFIAFPKKNSIRDLTLTLT